jgi:hypothetical protein
MEADITSQAVGLGANTDFSLMSLFLRADIIVKSGDDYFDSLLDLFMGSNNREN